MAAALDTVLVAAGVLISALASVFSIANRLALAQVQRAVAELRAELAGKQADQVAKQAEKCEKCEERFVSRREFTMLHEIERRVTPAREPT